MPCAEGEPYGVDTPRCLSASARTGSLAQYTSACALFFSAMRRFITPVLLDSSVSKTGFTVIPVSRSKSLRIGSEKTWSSLTYTTMLCCFEKHPGKAIPVATVSAATTAIISLRIEGSVAYVTTLGLKIDNSLRAAVSEIIERGHAVCLGPDPDLAGVLKGVVVPFDRLLSIKRDGEMIAAKIHT